MKGHGSLDFENSTGNAGLQNPGGRLKYPTDLPGILFRIPNFIFHKTSLSNQGGPGAVIIRQRLRFALSRV